MATEKKEKFDIQLVGNKFQAAIHEDDVKLHHYLESYKELDK